jgi:lysophospholipid acyltransferase (LPLAT)-like uncharacterized protein
MGLRKRIEQHPWFWGSLGAGLGLWMRFCAATTRWTRHGEAELEAALRDGPVILVLWHERIALVGVHWRRDWGPLSALHTRRFAGRVAGSAQGFVGLLPIAMDSRRSNRTASREVLRRLREGVSIGITGDGPQGPARILKDAPLDWARATGRPVFVYAFATRRQCRLPVWDRMVWPLPFTRGAAVWRLWEAELTRRVEAGHHEKLRRDLAAALDAVAAEAEALAQSPQRT